MTRCPKCNREISPLPDAVVVFCTCGYQEGQRIQKGWPGYVRPSPVSETDNQ